MLKAGAYLPDSFSQCLFHVELLFSISTRPPRSPTFSSLSYPFRHDFPITCYSMLVTSAMAGGRALCGYSDKGYSDKASVSVTPWPWVCGPVSAPNTPWLLLWVQHLSLPILQGLNLFSGFPSGVSLLSLAYQCLLPFWTRILRLLQQLPQASWFKVINSIPHSSGCSKSEIQQSHTCSRGSMEESGPFLFQFLVVALIFPCF